MWVFHLFLIPLDDRKVASVKDVSINAVCVIKLCKFVIFTLILRWRLSSGSKGYQLLEETKMLGDCSFTSQTACPQAFATGQNLPTGSSTPKGTCSLPGLRLVGYARGFYWCLRAVARMPVGGAPR
uniref:Uncharacterized protein n=1 Tax=Falco tinnunculus TaxID=100819 RepID=A0A8C4U797_FALTI